MKSIRIGQTLLDRTQAIGDRYGHTVNTIARKSLISYHKAGSPLDELENDTGTTRDGGTVLKLDTEHDQATTRRILDRYVRHYEALPTPEPPKERPAVIAGLREQARLHAKLAEHLADGNPTKLQKV